MASNYRKNSPLGTTGGGAYAVSKKGTTLPLQYVPMLGSLFSGLSNGGSGGSSGGGATTPPPASGGGTGAAPFQWTFPQYSQSWAFTPPAPTAFQMPPEFDPKSKTGYKELAKPPTTKTSAASPFSITDLMMKYK